MAPVPPLFDWARLVAAPRPVKKPALAWCGLSRPPRGRGRPRAKRPVRPQPVGVAFGPWPGLGPRHGGGGGGLARAAGPRPRRPRPLACPASPRLGPPLSVGLTPPAASPLERPRRAAPPLGRGLGYPEAVAAWQRAWVVGLLLRPRRWAAYLRF